MASEPIDTSVWPSMVSVQCGTGCGEWIVVDRAYTGTGFCSGCLADRTGGGVAASYPAPPEWSAAHNPVPPPAVYPERQNTVLPFRTDYDPNVNAVCISHPTAVAIPLMTVADAPLAYRIHDHLNHRRWGWLIGGPGGANGDVCDPCGGGTKDKKPLTDGPRHDLCLNGRTRGRGGDCPCRHDRPWMRGIKPGAPAAPAAAPAPEPAAAPVIPVHDQMTFTLDPEEDDSDDR